MAVDFKSLLQKPADTVKKPVPLPAGTYRGIVTSREFGTSKNRGTPFVRFTVQPQFAESDIAPEDLEGVEIAKKQLRIDLYLTADAEFRVVELANSLGYQSSGRSLGELIEDIASNSPVLIDVTQRSSEDGSTIYNDIAKLRGAND